MRTLYGQRLNTERHLSLSPCATIVVGFTLLRNICVNDRTVQSLANSKPLLVYFRSRFDENVIGFCANSTRLRLSNESARRGSWPALAKGTCRVFDVTQTGAASRFNQSRDGRRRLRSGQADRRTDGFARWGDGVFRRRQR